MIHSLIAMPLIDPIHISSGRLLWMLPLCLAIAIAYKALRCNHPREIPVASALLFVTIVGGMLGIGVVLQIITMIAT